MPYVRPGLPLAKMLHSLNVSDFDVIIAGTENISNKVMNSPPSATSCADSITPARINFMIVCCMSYSASKSNLGADDSFTP